MKAKPKYCRIQSHLSLERPLTSNANDSSRSLVVTPDRKTRFSGMKTRMICLPPKRFNQPGTRCDLAKDGSPHISGQHS